MALQKTGTDTQIVTGANTYSGGTTINAGTLLVANTTGSGTGTGAVTINSGGTLGGGTTMTAGIVTGTVAVNSGGHLLGGAGTAVGALTLTMAPMLNSGSIIELALGSGGAHSTLILPTGFTSFNSNQNFVMDGLQVGTYDNIITGVAASGFSTTNWTITNAPGTSIYSFTDDGSNIDLTVTAVPEPATWAAGVCCVGLAALKLRSRLARA